MATVVLTVASILVLTSDPPDNSPLGPVALEGESVFRAKGCSGCHTAHGVDSPTNAGPDLTGLAARAAERVVGLDAEAYVRQSVLAPQAFIVPGFGSLDMPTLPLNEAEVEALLAFLLDG